MTLKKTRQPKTFYATALSPPELRNFPNLRSANPADEIAVLRVLIRRMLHTLNDITSFHDAIQAANAISYITGRLAKLCEVQNSQGESSSDFSMAYLLSLEEMVHRFSPPNDAQDGADQPPLPLAGDPAESPA